MGSQMFYGDYQFSPVPLMTWTSETVRDSKLDPLTLKHTLNFTGHLLEVAVSESGNFVTMWNQKEALRNALASGNQHLQILFDGQSVLSGVYPKVTNLEFPEGTWADRIDYSFTVEYEENFYNTGVQSITESWDFTEQEDRTTATVQHNINAVGVNTSPSGANNAFTNAKTYVLARTGYDNVVAGTPLFVQVSGTYNAYEGLRNEQIDVAAGSFGVTETFVLSSGTYIHTRTGQSNIDNNGITELTIDGIVQGLGRGLQAIERALVGWDNTVKPAIPADASGIYSNLGGEGTLYTTSFRTFSVTKNDSAGTISYSASYSDSPKDNIPSGIQDFTIAVSDQKPMRVFASFAIMERTLGNVIQDIGTSNEGQFSINGTCIGKVNYPFASVLSYVQDQVNIRRPLAINYQTLRLTTQNITKEEEKNTINFNFTWTYTKELSAVPGSTGPVIID